ncbi:MAG: asparagine--tRNA ligase [Candidatus Anammoxibacter sp.]
MPQTYINQLGKHTGKEVNIKGWLYNKRSSGKMQFLLVRDGTGIVQSVLFKGDVSEELFKLCDTISQESSLELKGVVREDKRSPGGYELSVLDIKLVQKAMEYPISPKSHGADFLLGNRHLWIRSKKQHATLRIRDEIVKAIRDYFYERDFVLVDAPIFTPAACEGTTTVFEVDYFDEKAYLTQSGQLYMEAACMAFGKAYCFGPTFRAEKSKTKRHLTEFWMVEPEIAYADLNDIMDMTEDFVSYIIQRVLKNRKDELEVLERDTKLLEDVVPPFPRLSYDEAVEMMKSEGHDFNRGGDFGAPDEMFISEHFKKPVLIHRFPAQIKAFYMKNDPENNELALCVDMLAPEGVGEIIGGGQREDDLEILKNKIAAHDLPEDSFGWYLDLRKYGSVPHAGFGLGIERMVTWVCGSSHVRETIPFPRMLYRIYP